MRRTLAWLVLAVAVVACSLPETSATTPAPENSVSTVGEGSITGSATTPTEPGSLPGVDSRATSSDPLSPEAQAVLDDAWAAYPEVEPESMTRLGASGDLRLAWLLADYLRFNFVADAVAPAREAFGELTGVEITSSTGWVSAVNELIARDVPAFPGYIDYKRTVFVTADERWELFFPEESDIDFRWLTWGGVAIDDSPAGQSQNCSGCIPGVDDPQTTTADDGDWYPDDRAVLGVTVNGESRAYPLNIAEVHELFNDTLGGRDFTLPYCTLCGSAQLYFTDNLPTDFARPYLRTSGLLTRSNKVMYDVVTGSVFDTFTGVAISGPLWEAGVQLEQGSVVTTSWGEWKAEFPDTTIVELAEGSGRVYRLDPLGDRDAAGPIFPISEVDQRLGAHDAILGVVLGDGSTVAFPVEAAATALEAGSDVSIGGVDAYLEAGGLRAAVGGVPVASAQAFWFAWSQFHPDTLLWAP